MDPKAPRDSLDFVLKATYDHHKEYLKGKNETLVQQETLGYNHGYDWTHYVYILYKLIKYIIVDFNVQVPYISIAYMLCTGVMYLELEMTY